MLNDSLHTKFTYDPDSHITTCKRNIHNKVYVGSAKCHPNDYDFESKLVGEHFAYTRSMISELCANRDELNAELKIVKHLYNILEQNPRVHYDSVECFIIRRQIKLLERDIAEIRDLIKETRLSMKTIINEKDQLYNQLRIRRKKNGNAANT